MSLLRRFYGSLPGLYLQPTLIVNFDEAARLH
jgi:hypothetical protein